MNATLGRIPLGRNRFGLFCLLAILIGNTAFLSWNAFRGFNLFDMGCMMDGGWRILKGQKPYTDFIFITGPIHLYLHAFFFKIFGFGKAAILAHLAVLHSIVIVLTYLAARRFLGPGLTFLVVMLTVTSFNWPFSHPWYDQSAHFWGIIGVFSLIVSLPFRDAKTALGLGFFGGSMAVLSYMTKSNIGSSYVLLFLLTFLSSPHRRRAFQGYLAGSAVTLGFMFIFLIPSLPAFLEQTVWIWSQNQTHRRLGEFFVNPNWIYLHHYWIIVLIVGFANGWSFIVKNKERFTLFASLAGVAMFSNITSSAIHAANGPLMGIFMATALILSHRRFVTGMLVILCVSFTLLYAKYGLELKVWTYTGANAVGDYKLKNGPLKGWGFHQSDGEALDGLIAFVNANVPAGESLLVLTDLQILYACTGRDSFRGVPHNFLPGDLPAPGKQLEDIRQNILKNPPDWVVTHRDKTSFVTLLVPYLRLVETIQEDYVLVRQWHNYVILKRKSGPLPNS